VCEIAVTDKILPASSEKRLGENVTRWNDPETDRLLAEGGRMPDGPERKELYCKAPMVSEFIERLARR
jgi:hypothetical protein